ncbi:MAG: acyltransferase [Cyanobacteria bacterium J06555_13]
MTTSEDSPRASATRHFFFLDALRGLAALWVVLFHSQLKGQLSHLSSALPDEVFSLVFQRGSLGVPIFFVISGFVIAHSLRKSTINRSFLKQFALRRFARLNPPYYASILFALGVAALASLAKQEPYAPMNAALSPQRLLAHLLYLQDVMGLEHFNDVYWTLCLEVQFYLVFVALLWLIQHLQVVRGWRWGRAVTLVFGSAAVLSMIHPMGLIQVVERPVLFLPHFHCFLVGIFAYWAWQRRFKIPVFYTYAGVLAIVAIARERPFTLIAAVVAMTLFELGRAQ